MAVLGSRVTVAATPTLICAGLDVLSNARPVIVTNTGAATIDLGGATVATGAGYSLPANASVALSLMAGDDLYGVTSAGTVVVSVLQGRS